MGAKPYVEVLRDVSSEKLERIIRGFTLEGAKISIELQPDNKSYKITAQFPPDVVKKMRLGRV